MPVFLAISNQGIQLEKRTRPNNDFLPILCAGVYRNNGTEILLGVRKPDTNLTHPDTISSFTLRIPSSLADSILDEKTTTAESNRKIELSIPAPSEVRLLESRRKRSHDPVYFAVRALLGYKLSIGEKIDIGEIDFTCKPVSTLTGLVYHEFGGEKTVEKNLMLYVEVNLKNGSDKIPLQSSSYSLLKWISREDFLTMYDLRDPTIFSGDLNPSKICVKGLCLKIIADTLRLNETKINSLPTPERGSV